MKQISLNRKYKIRLKCNNSIIIKEGNISFKSRREGSIILILVEKESINLLLISSKSLGDIYTSIHNKKISDSGRCKQLKL